MFAKALLCGAVLGCFSSLAALVERSDVVARLPVCAAGDAQCAAPGNGQTATTERFFAMLAMH